jgi:enoyl-CoA hydratase/carnithine racemase
MDTQDTTVLVQKLQPEMMVLILNRPESANALNQRMAEEVARIFDEIQKDSTIRVVILAGYGNKAFCAGADLKERKGMTEMFDCKSGIQECQGCGDHRVLQ